MQNNAPLYAFNAGEVSRIALARVDQAKMRMAAACQLNWMPLVLGPMMLRPGMGMIGEIFDDAPAKLIGHVYAKTDTSLLEFTDSALRIWINDQLLTRAAVSTTVGDSTFNGGGAWVTGDTSSGASATIGSGLCTLTCTPIGGLARVKQQISVSVADRGKEHGVRIVVTNGPLTVRAGSTDGASDLLAQTVLDTGTHSLSLSPSSDIFLQIESTDARAKTLTGVSIEPAGVVVLPTPYTATDLDNIRHDASGDVIYLACYGFQQRKIERRGTRPGARGWSVVLYRSDNGPFQQSPGLEANFTPGAYYGNTTLNSDQPWFQPQHVGALFRLFSPAQSNQAVLGNQNAFTDPVRVSGVGTASRNYVWTASGSFSGILTFQRSFDGPDSGFVDISTSGSGSITSATGGTSGSPDLDNAICWERVGFKAAAYTSGSAVVVSNYAGGGGYGSCRVTSFQDNKNVSIEILDAFSSLSATNDWLESDWSALVGYPTTVGFHEGRLGFAGRDEVWLSHSDSYADFRDIDDEGQPIGDAGALNYAMGSGPFDTISWLLSLTRLQIGREQSIGSARSSNFDQPLTPTDIVIRDSSDQGAERLPAVKCGKRGIFVQQSGGKVYELFFNPQEMDYDDKDLTRLNLEIGATGFVDIDKSTQPDKMIWLPRGDGQLAALVYDVKDEVEAWWRAQTLGVVERVCVLPRDGLEDAVYLQTRRNINGQTKRFLEKFATRADCVGGTLNLQLDCYITYQGAPTSTVSVPHLPNTVVTVWADGQAIGAGTTDSSGNMPMPDALPHSAYVAGLAGATVIGATEEFLKDGTTKPNQRFAAPQGTLTVGSQYEGYPAEVFADIAATGRLNHIGALSVSGGVITLPNNQVAGTIIAFLGYAAPYMSAKMAYAAAAGSALTRRKKIDSVGMVMAQTAFQAVKFGDRLDDMIDMPSVEEGLDVPASTVWTEYDEPAIPLPKEWSTDSRLCLLAMAPKPAMVCALVIDVQTNG